MSIISNHTLLEYLEGIEKAEAKRSESVCSRTADKFEDDLLEFEGFPADHFSFVLELLSNSRLYSKPGIWNFLLVLSTENHKLRREHYDALAKTILDQYVNYVDPDLCLAVCDFLARNYPEREAEDILNMLRMVESDKDERLRGFAIDGLRIVKLEAARRDSGPSLAPT